MRRLCSVDLFDEINMICLFGTTIAIIPNEPDITEISKTQWDIKIRNPKHNGKNGHVFATGSTPGSVGEAAEQRPPLNAPPPQRETPRHPSNPFVDPSSTDNYPSIV